MCAYPVCTHMYAYVFGGRRVLDYLFFLKAKL
jgi:hypothetical protein